jgi:hypothetical protein
MTPVKTTICVVIGVLIANLMTHLAVTYAPQIKLQPAQAQQTAAITPASTFQPLVLSELRFINNSGRNLSCVHMVNGNMEQFLSLSAHQERQYTHIKDSQTIGCSISIDERSSTILNWFPIQQAGTYTLHIQQVPCSKCKGRTTTWGTVVTKPGGEQIIPSF